MVGKSAFLPGALALALLPLGAMPAAASDPCLLCQTPGASSQRGAGPAGPGADEAAVPLRIDIISALDFSRLTAGGFGGGVEMDPVTGQRRLQGGAVDLGGFAMTGEAEVRGAPGRSVRILLPDSVTLESDSGRPARVSNLATDVGLLAALGPDGRLRFRFGGRLAVSGELDGTYRGRIPISVTYE